MPDAAGGAHEEPLRSLPTEQLRSKSPSEAPQRTHGRAGPGTHVARLHSGPGLWEPHFPLAPQPSPWSPALCLDHRFLEGVQGMWQTRWPHPLRPAHWEESNGVQYLPVESLPPPPR